MAVSDWKKSVVYQIYPKSFNARLVMVRGYKRGYRKIALFTKVRCRLYG